MKTVGKSDHRTPAKHGVLDLMLGRDIAVIPEAARRLRIPMSRISMFDLTAGDGATDGIGSTASPYLFAKHSLYRPGCPIDVKEIELTNNTWRALLANLTVHMPHISNKKSKARYQQCNENSWVSTDNISTYSAILGNGLHINLDEYGRGDWLFIYNDPNHIHDWALPCESVARAVERGIRLTAMSTMGCNVGGLKMLKMAERERWFDTVHSMNEIVRRLRNIDNLLVPIERDDSQWAYLLTRPYKWTVDDDRKAIANIFKKQGLSVKIFSMRDEPSAFEECLDVLFRTQKEQKERAA